MHNLSDRQYEEILYNVVQGLTPEQLKKSVYEFVVLLAKDHKLSHGEKILKDFIKIAKQKEGIIDLQITTARPLSEPLKKTISEVFGKNVDITEKIDKSLIGGFVAKTRDMIMDVSVKGRLDQFKEILTQ